MVTHSNVKQEVLHLNVLPSVTINVTGLCFVSKIQLQKKKKFKANLSEDEVILHSLKTLIFRVRIKSFLLIVIIFFFTAIKYR